jgi:hypothetical protein
MAAVTPIHDQLDDRREGPTDLSWANAERC